MRLSNERLITTGKLMENESHKHIAIGLGTFRRNELLRCALTSLTKIEVPQNVLISLVVCDNDSLPSAKPVFQELKEIMPFECIYLHEPKQGLVRMRNRILTQSLEMGAGFLAFFDDDEHVHKNWLVELYCTLSAYKAAAVGGLVVSQQSNFVAAGEIMSYFKNFELTGVTGEEKDLLATNNVLIDLRFVRNHDIEFRNEFNFLGGEDAFFFEDIKLSGGKLIWSNEAIVYTELSQDRLNEEYALKMQARIVHFEYLKTALRNGKRRAILKALRLCFSHITTIIRKKRKGNLSNFEFARRKVAIRTVFQALAGKKLEFYGQ